MCHAQAMTQCMWTGLYKGNGWEEGAQYAKQHTPATSTGAAAGTLAADGARLHIVCQTLACLTK